MKVCEPESGSVTGFTDFWQVCPISVDNIRTVLSAIGNLLKQSVIYLYRKITFRGEVRKSSMPANMRRDCVASAIRRAKQKSDNREQNEAAEIARGDRRG